MDQETAADARDVPSPGAGVRVAIIGAGPAGLAAARELARDGIGVTIFEARPYAGGMVGGAIPEYRLPQARLDQDLAVLDRLGVEIRYGQTAGVDITLEGLQADGYAATFVAVGAQVARRLDLPGEDADGIVDGVTFLRSVREGRPTAVGPRVGVIGAGDTAMDCARSALRLGAATVSLIYRRTVDQMPADPEEVHDSVAEGVRLLELASPSALHVENGKLAGLVCTRTEYRGERDASGRKVPFDIAGSDFEIGLDTLIVAVSQHSMLDFFGDRRPELTPAGFIAVDPVTFETSITGVYAGGDVAAHGPSSIVRAAADGKRVATAIAAAHGIVRPVAATAADPIDVHGLIVRRARREYRVPVRVSGLEDTDRLRGDDPGVYAGRGDRRGIALSGLPPDLQPVRRCLPEHGPDDVRIGADRDHAAGAQRARWCGRGDRAAAPVRGGPAAPDRGPDRFLQRVRELRHRMPDLGISVPRQAAPLSRPGGLHGAGFERLHASWATG